MLDETTQARLAERPCWAGSASRWRSPTPWRFWCPSTRRSSPVPSSSSTADNPCRSDEGGNTLSVGVIGAGPGGLALGIFLKKAGFRDFTIFDREDGVGGTWRINTYPGLACDVKSHLYSFSFDLNANWSRLWSGQPEILEYFERCAQRYRSGPQSEAEHRDDIGRTGTRKADVAGEHESTGERHVRHRGVGRGLFTQPVLPDSRRGAVYGNADAHRAVGPLGRPAGRTGGRAGNGVDRVAGAARGGQGRQERVLGAALADLDPAEAGPRLHGPGEMGVRACAVRQEVLPDPAVAAQ